MSTVACRRGSAAPFHRPDGLHHPVFLGSVGNFWATRLQKDFSWFSMGILPDFSGPKKSFKWPLQGASKVSPRNFALFSCLVRATPDGTAGRHISPPETGDSVQKRLPRACHRRRPGKGDNFPAYSGHPECSTRNNIWRRLAVLVANKSSSR